MPTINSEVSSSTVLRSHPDLSQMWVGTLALRLRVGDHYLRAGQKLKKKQNILRFLGLIVFTLSRTRYNIKFFPVTQRQVINIYTIYHIISYNLKFRTPIYSKPTISYSHHLSLHCHCHQPFHSPSRRVSAVPPSPPESPDRSSAPASRRRALPGPGWMSPARTWQRSLGSQTRWTRHDCSDPIYQRWNVS